MIENLITFNHARKNPIDFTASEITITQGASYGIYTALSAILEIGDEVIVLEPAYDSYIPRLIESNTVFLVSLKIAQPDFEQQKQSITEKPKLSSSIITPA